MHPIIFSTKTCHYCKEVKKWLDEKGIDYNEVDVGVDKVSREEIQNITKQKGVPVIKVGETYIVGFNKDKLAKALGLMV